jgi:N,N'-diacetyllegionaminate synthase
MVRAIRNIEVALGDGVKRLTPSEERNQPIGRKSIVAAKEIKPGDVFSTLTLTCKRPGTGISPMEWDNFIGSKARQQFKPDQNIDK